MPLCNRKQCPHKGIDLPASEFKDGCGRTTKACKHCRSKERGYWKKSYYEKRGYDSPVEPNSSHNIETIALRIREVLEPGSPPKFNFEWEQDRYEAWLEEICASVIRS